MRHTNTFTRLLLVASFAIPLFACGSAQSVAPTPSPPGPTAPPPSSRSTGWIVTIRTTAVTGPTFCIYTPSVGSVFQGDYDVVQHGDTVAFIPPDPIDWDSFTGSLTGSDFVATNPPFDSGAGMCTHYLQASDLAGSFSADTNAFTALAHWYFTLDSGEVKTVTFSWSGVRR